MTDKAGNPLCENVCTSMHGDNIGMLTVVNTEELTMTNNNEYVLTLIEHAIEQALELIHHDTRSSHMSTKIHNWHIGRLSCEWHIAHIKHNSRSFHIHFWWRVK